MELEKTILEVTAPTADEAIKKGLDQLGMSLEEVELEVIDQGSRGLFGLRSRLARVRMTIKINEGHQGIPKTSEESIDRIPDAIAVPQAARDNAIQGEVKQEIITTPPLRPVSQSAHVVVDQAEIDSARSIPKAQVVNEADEPTRVAIETVKQLIDKMRIRATVTGKYVQAEDGEEQRTILIDIRGNDLSVLIGRRSEVLNALQYIASQIIDKKLKTWIPILIDVQGFRSRRENQLRQLARRMAEQAMTSGRRQVLEPMPANERRFIHLELKDHPSVITESTGEEPNRKVTIFPK